MTVFPPNRRAGRALALAVLLAPLAAVAAPADEIRAAAAKFMSARSYHVTLDSPATKTRITMDFQAPDRYRMQTPAGTQTIIGDTIHMQVNGRTMVVPMPKGTVTQWRQTSQWTEGVASMTVKAAGTEVLGGVQARKYLIDYTRPTAGSMTMWLGPDGYPMQVVTPGKAGATTGQSTIRYSRFNDPGIVIASK